MDGLESLRTYRDGGLGPGLVSLLMELLRDTGARGLAMVSLLMLLLLLSLLLF